jgi:hypothetical protein
MCLYLEEEGHEMEVEEEDVVVEVVVEVEVEAEAEAEAEEDPSHTLSRKNVSNGKRTANAVGATNAFSSTLRWKPVKQMESLSQLKMMKLGQSLQRMM